MADMPPERSLVRVVFPTLLPASRDLLAAFSDSQSFAEDLLTPY